MPRHSPTLSKNLSNVLNIQEMHPSNQTYLIRHIILSNLNCSLMSYLKSKNLDSFTFISKVLS